jgi:coatomer protein complex subunit gamma
MVYLGIKELSAIAEDVIIVTSSLTKDMTGKEDLYRAAAIRALCSITDVSISLYILCWDFTLQQTVLAEECSFCIYCIFLNTPCTFL